MNIVPHLWYTKDAEEAAKFYVSVLPDSRIDHISDLPVDSPSGPAGSVKVVEFTLIGRPFMAIAAGPFDTFNHSVSFIVECDDQKQIDRLWAKLSQGGSTEPCGWLKDKYGLSWQIVPVELQRLLTDKDRSKAARVATAMLEMGKIDIAQLQAAARKAA